MDTSNSTTKIDYVNFSYDREKNLVVSFATSFLQKDTCFLDDVIQSDVIQ